MEKRDRAREALDQVRESFETGQLEGTAAMTYIKRLEGGRPSDSWSFMNRMIMMIHQTDDARGFKQWQKANRNVKKGTKAFYILAPRMITDKDEAGEETKRIAGFLGIAVFRADDTEGEAIVYPDYDPPKPPPLIEVAARLGCKVTWQGGGGMYLGSYSPTTKDISLMSHEDSVFFHELSHAAHDTFSKKMGPGQDPYRETVAEFSAAVLARMFGQRTDRHAYQYIKRYSGDPVKAIMKVMKDVEKVLDIILSPEMEIAKAS